MVGQPNFTSQSTVVTQSVKSGANYSAISSLGVLVVGSQGTGRELIWNFIPTANGQPADVVIGQTNFTIAVVGVSATKLNIPAGLIVAPDGRLSVNDLINNRVLIYNSIPTTNGAAADVVIGQPTTSLPPLAADSPASF